MTNVCTEEKQLHYQTRSMAKTKQADVPSIYPLKGEHKKPEPKQVNIDKKYMNLTEMYLQNLIR